CAARTWLTDALRDLGYEARSTPGNFILLRVDDPHALVADLRSRDIYIRDRSDLPQLEGYLRITVGTRAQCEQVLSAIQDAMAGTLRAGTCSTASPSVSRIDVSPGVIVGQPHAIASRCTLGNPSCVEQHTNATPPAMTAGRSGSGTKPRKRTPRGWFAAANA